ncbi:cryptochrome/photolyase family protein, partial [Rickettsiales bacterium]|nr:cryptochrome/photolyase family protein [Rickettsiales bacterium]
EIIITKPSNHKILQIVKSWQKQFNIKTIITDDNRFLATDAEFQDWAKGKKQLRMEFFYRLMRSKYNILMQGNKPIGGKWNYDADNRKSPDINLLIPKPYYTKHNQITKASIALVEQLFNDNFGDIEPFHFATKRGEALKVLEHFIETRLKNFGDYQDAMIEGEPWMFHSHISFYLNSGLLTALECVKKAETAFNNGSAPLNAVEGFIRQIIGWREYIRGIYWLKMPEYKSVNFFNAKNNLPEFYWTADTKMNCLKQAVSETKANAYAHHIQRLMVLGNFALIAGINPDEVNEWFLIVYADAYEWVELPNVTGMILFADGGYLASKPYASGGSYINKMSNYCKNCSYKISHKTGDKACPFNYLYWDFLERNRDKLSSNHRIGMMYKVYDRMKPENQKAIKNDSNEFLKSLK